VGRLNPFAGLLCDPGAYLAVMTSSRARRQYLPGSPFQPDPEPVIEQFDCGDLVSHDAYGMGRVVGREAQAVTVDFRTQTVRVMSPFHKMAKL
jgi:hypothetical protein